jgi:hypothetical protein
LCIADRSLDGDDVAVPHSIAPVEIGGLLDVKSHHSFQHTADRADVLTEF